MKKIFILAVIFPLFAFASLNVDSLKNEIHRNKDEDKIKVINRIASFYASTQYDSSERYYKMLINEADKINDIYEKGKGFANIAFINIRNGDMDKAESFLHKALMSFKEINDSTGISYVYNQFAKLLENKGKLDSSAILYRFALKYSDYDKLDDNLKIENPNISTQKKIKTCGIVLTDFGLMQVDIKNFNVAIEYFNKTLDIGKYFDDPKRISGSYSNLGMIYDRMGDDEKALENYGKALHYADKGEILLYKTTILNNLGSLYIKNNNYEKALHYFSRAVNLAKKTGDKEGIMFYGSNKALSLSNLGNKAESLKLADSILTNFKQFNNYLNNLTVISNTYNNLAKVYYDNQKYEKSYDMLQKHIIYKDSILNLNTINKVNELKEKFESEKKDFKINLLTKEQNIKDLQILLSIGIIILIIIIAVILYSRYKVKVNANTKLKEYNDKLLNSETQLKELLNTKDKFFSIIAHDLKGPIGTYKNILEYIQKDFESISKSDLKDYINEIKSSSDNLFKLLEDLLEWARSQTGKIKYVPTMIDIETLIKTNIDILSISAQKKNINLNYSIKDKVTVYADVPMVTTIIRNIISNAIKFSYANDTISLDVKKEKNMAHISIVDQGVGMTEEEINKVFNPGEHHTTKGTAEEKGTGLGLILCKEFIQKNKGDIFIHSEKGKGSTIGFTLPLSKN